MHVSLTPELEARVKAKVESGLYNNASEVVREALRFMETHDELVYEMKLVRLREQLRTGVNQLERGEGVQLESPSAVDGFFGHITGQNR